jgi:phosphopantothenoylcysteine decarboxylase/phosphopantothenate--cysteine ligase
MSESAEDPLRQQDLQAHRILLGVSSSIALHRALDLSSALIKRGAHVQVLMTEDATRLIQPIAFEAITHRHAVSSLWERPRAYEMEHLELTKWAELFIIAPATANILGKLAHGIADDALTTAALAWSGPILLAPAMNPAMWSHPAVRENVALLSARGCEFVGPVSGTTACGDVGLGRMAPVEDILRRIENCFGILAARRAGTAGLPLAGKTVLVTSGPTREYLDPVRFLSNPSSGKMGHALAAEAARRGAHVILVHGPVTIPRPEGVQESFEVTTAEEMNALVARRVGDCDILIFAAAVSDWRPAQRLDRKQKKEQSGQSIALQLVRNPDIAMETLATARPEALRVGFAAETHDLRANAEVKRKEKKFDLLVANDVMAPDSGFAADTNQAWLLTDHHEPRSLPGMTKTDLAREILNEIERLLALRATLPAKMPIAAGAHSHRKSDSKSSNSGK